MVSLMRPIYIPVRIVTNKVGDDISKGLRDSRSRVSREGESLGQAFSRGFNKGIDTNGFDRVRNGIRSMVPEAQGAIAAFHTLTRTAHTLGAALPVLVGGISSVISSLGALIGSAGGAISTVSVLGNAIFALGAGMAVSRLALGGVGKALTNLNKQTASAAGTSARAALQSVRDSQAREAAAKRIEDAERSLARTIESNAERIAQANQDIEDAQAGVTKAIREGREQLQQLGFDAEDAALSEKKAAIELEKARETLARVQDLPPNSRARREAELAYQEAELNYRKAKDANADLAKEQDRLTKSGVNGLQGVIDARKKLADAEQNKAKVVKDALQSEEDALRNVTDARQAAQNVETKQDAADDIPGAAGLGQAWDQGLNDAQRTFALFLQSLKPKVDELKRIAAEGFLPDLQIAIQMLADKAYPTIANGVDIVARAMGAASITLAQYITQEQNLAKLNSIFESSGRLIELFGSMLGRAYDILLSILQTTAPMAERFFGFINDQLGSFANYLNSVDGNNALVSFFSRAEATAVKFGSVFGNVFRGIGGIINANLGPGTGGDILLTWLDKATADWGSSPGLVKFFQDVATNATHVLDALTGLIGILGRLGQNQNIGKTFDILQKAEPALENILQIGANAGPSLAQLVVTITDIISALSDTGAMTVFFDTLNNIATAVKNWVSDPANKQLLDTLGRIFSVFSAIGLVGGIVTFGMKSIAGGVMQLLKPFGMAVSGAETLGKAFSNFNNLRGATLTTVDGVTGKLTVMGTAARVATGNTLGMSRAFEAMGAPARGAQAAFGAIGGVLTTAGRGLATFGKALGGVLLGPVGIVIGVIAALVGIFIALYNTNAEFKKQMDEVWADLSKVFADSGAQIMEALKPLIPVFGEIVSALAPVVTALVSALVPIIKALVPIIAMLVKAIAPLIAQLAEALVPVFKLLADVLSFIIPILAQVIGFIVQVLAAILKVVIEVITAIIVWVIDAITNFGKNWNDFWTGIGKFFSDMWNGLVSFVTDVWNNINNAIQAAINWLVDLFLNWTIYGLIIQNWDAIVQFFQDTWNNIMGFFDAAFKWIDQFVLQPMGLAFKAIGDTFDAVGRFIGDVWVNIQNAINAVWKWIDANIFKPIRDAVDLIAWAFQNSGVLIDAAWKLLQDNLNNVWQWINSNVFNPIKDAVALVQQAFENTVKGIDKAWQGIKAAAAVPVNFVIDTVYNNGLRSFWNDIAGNLGMNNLKLPRANTVAFASGGVLPGYSPGRDIHKFYSPTGGYLHLSGGEAIMRPEWTRMMGGPAAIARMNRAAMRGQRFATGGVFNGGGSGYGSSRVQRFKTGGIVDFAGDVLDNIGKAFEVIGDFFANPIQAVQTHLVDGLIKPLLNQSGRDDMFSQLVGGVPIKIAEGIGQAVAKFFEDNPRQDAPANAIGWRAMWNIVSRVFPWATLNDGYRDPAQNAAVGGVNGSYHTLGRAIDVTPSMEIFNWLAKNFPNSRELIYSPAGGRQLLNGKPYFWGDPVRSMHFNHVHWAMAKGGTVYPTPDGTIVRVAEAGKPERVEPLDPNGLSDRDKALIDHLTVGGGGTTINVYQLPGEDTETLARRISELLSRDMRRGALR